MCSLSTVKDVRNVTLIRFIICGVVTVVTLMTSGDTRTTPTHCIIDGFMPDKVISNDKRIMMLTGNEKHSKRQTHTAFSVLKKKAGGGMIEFSQYFIKKIYNGKLNYR